MARRRGGAVARRRGGGVRLGASPRALQWPYPSLPPPSGSQPCSACSAASRWAFAFAAASACSAASRCVTGAPGLPAVRHSQWKPQACRQLTTCQSTLEHDLDNNKRRQLSDYRPLTHTRGPLVITTCHARAGPSPSPPPPPAPPPRAGLRCRRPAYTPPPRALGLRLRRRLCHRLLRHLALAVGAVMPAIGEANAPASLSTQQ